MKAVNEVKPINVLARFIATWIRDHDDDAAPFDSFEAMRPEPIEQKDVERWVLNCNYTYYRLGDMLVERDLFPDDDARATEMFTFLDANIKSIRDSNPLNLRSKQPAAIVGELGKDWPPFCKKSRNDVSKLAPQLRAFAQTFAPSVPELPKALQDFATELADEAHYYRSVAQQKSDTGAEGAVVARCRKLLPVWCAKEINPLFTLLMWQDEQAVSQLAEELARAFAANGYPSFDGGSKHDAYRGVVRMSQRLFLEGMRAADDTDARGLTIPDIARHLDNGFFSLEHPAPVPDLPAWLPGKTLLIWNTVIRAIAGPREAIRPTGSNRTATTIEPAQRSTVTRAVHGEALLRRCLQNGDREVAGTVDLSVLEPEGTTLLPSDNGATRRLWRIMGSAFDEQAREPAALEAVAQDIPKRFLSTARFDEHGNQIEGRGDSRYHAMLSLVQDAGGWSVELRDLGSKNGTYVMRSREGRRLFFVLSSRGSTTAEAWAAHMGVDASDVAIIDAITLERGDIIQLCGSRFELL